MRRPTLIQKEALAGFGYVLPALLGIALFAVIPFVIIIIFSFSSAGIGAFRWNGITNYRSLLLSPAFRLALENTGKFMLIGIPIVVGFAMILALLLHSMELRNSRAYALLFALNLCPMVMPSGSIMLFFRVMFERYGILNSLLHATAKMPVDWLHGDITFWILLLVYVWKSYGYCMIILLSGLKNCDVSMHEAAALDGAGTVRRFFALTLPDLKPLLQFSAVLSTINVFATYRESFLLLGNYPTESAYMLPNFLMNSFQSFNFPQMYSATTLFLGLSALVTAGSILSVKRKKRRNP